MSVFFFLNNDKNAFNLYSGKSNETHERVTRIKKKYNANVIYLSNNSPKIYINTFASTDVNLRHFKCCYLPLT